MATARLLLKFTVTGTAQPRGSKTIGRTKEGRTFIRDDNPASGQWMKVVKRAAMVAMRSHNKTPSAKPILLVVTIYLNRPQCHFGTGRNASLLKGNTPAYPTTKPDLTKCIRGIEDAMTEVVWMDDSQVVEQKPRKRYVEHETWEAYAAREIANGKVPKARPECWGKPRVDIAVYELPASVAEARPTGFKQKELV